MPAERDFLKKVWSHFRDFQHVFLATMESDHPRVRPVTLIHLDKKFWVTTETKSAKVKQIQRNPKVEFCLNFKERGNDCCVRVAGLAKIVKEQETKTRIANHCSFFHKHWESVDDPNFTLLEICPSEIEYVSPNKTVRLKV